LLHQKLDSVSGAPDLQALSLAKSRTEAETVTAPTTATAADTRFKSKKMREELDIWDHDHVSKKLSYCSAQCVADDNVTKEKTQQNSQRNQKLNPFHGLEQLGIERQHLQHQFQQNFVRDKTTNPNPLLELQLQLGIEKQHVQQQLQHNVREETKQQNLVELQDLGPEYLEQLLSSSGSPSTGTEPE
jgi:hypothetical protein